MSDDNSAEDVASATPSSISAKRKRRDTAMTQRSNRRQRTIESENSESDDNSDESSEQIQNGGPRGGLDASDDDSGDESGEDYYDPDQPLEERRKVQRGLRGLLKNVIEKREEYLQGDSRGLKETIEKANSILKQVKRPGEAASDSRLLVSTTDLSYQRTLRLTHGTLAQGMNVDDFVSRCIVYMRQGRGIEDDDAPELSSTQRQRRTATSQDPGEDDEDIGDEGDMMNWSHLGRFAVLPNIRRPALPGFLLGPLSVEKKARKITKRSAPLRPNDLRETRPEVLDVASLAKKENDLTAICGQILQQLVKTQSEVQQTVVDLIDDDMPDDQKVNIMHQHGLRSTGGIDLLRFVVNPRSFGQTVENIFYVSFLIRDGRVSIEYDDNDLPSLAPVMREVDEEPSLRQGGSKHQAILSMDMATWEDIVETLELAEPLIKHRAESTLDNPGAKGWYS
uniref:Non-structural maintenance of chromosomes element 4 n=1 Tax=Bionectria ochroleuca TaxID=29856 RepID=A0A8H7NKE7_BIOOC